MYRTDPYYYPIVGCDHPIAGSPGEAIGLNSWPGFLDKAFHKDLSRSFTKIASPSFCLVVRGGGCSKTAGVDGVGVDGVVACLCLTGIPAKDVSPSSRQPPRVRWSHYFSGFQLLFCILCTEGEVNDCLSRNRTFVSFIMNPQQREPQY